MLEVPLTGVGSIVIRDPATAQNLGDEKCELRPGKAESVGISGAHISVVGDLKRIDSCTKAIDDAVTSTEDPTLLQKKPV